MNHDPLNGLLVSLALLSLPILVILWVAYIISATSSLSKIRKEAEAQTRLLEQIAKQTAPPPEPGKTPRVSLDYIRDDNKAGAGTILFALVAVGAVLLIIAMARK